MSELLPKAQIKLAIAFGESHVLNYDDNRDFFLSAGFRVEVCDDAGVADVIKGLLNEIECNAESVSILVDISSTSRKRLADILVTLAGGLGPGMPRDLDFVYSIARYAPDNYQPNRNRDFGPINATLAGWKRFPNISPAVICGVGYEEDRALGALEQLESQDAWLFVPKSSEPEYTIRVREMNERILGDVHPSRQIEYVVEDVGRLYVMLESLIASALRDADVVIVPFGPKIFALCSCLIALEFGGRVGVWRVGSAVTDDPVDRIPSGRMVYLRVARPEVR